MRILILGAGCTGLGAAYRLHELGHTDFLVLEKNNYPGGLAASFVDEKGFTWDIGGHVQFSHYEYFDRLMDAALGDAWLRHVRQSYIWAYGKFIPYPFQNNLRHLPPKELAACVLGLLRAQRNGHRPPASFREWILQTFGEGIAESFLTPYNLKVWAYPLERLSYSWIGERVATVDFERALENVLLGRDDPGWGPNSTFRFPLKGGTGAIWRAVAGLVPARRFRYSTAAAKLDLDRRVVTADDGSEHCYDVLISSLPLDVLADLSGVEALRKEARQLAYSTSQIVGVGLRGAAPEHLRTKNWMYFPEGDCPFYRLTVFSNYSPNNVPDASRYWSLMAEVSESTLKPVETGGLVADVLRGLLSTRLIASESDVVSVWPFRAVHGYPIPTTDRDGHLGVAMEFLEGHDVYSRGRFGAWKYEVGNQDHACMQGIELVNRLLLGTPELTVPFPAEANAGTRHETARSQQAVHVEKQR